MAEPAQNDFFVRWDFGACPASGLTRAPKNEKQHSSHTKTKRNTDHVKHASASVTYLIREENPAHRVQRYLWA